MSLPSYIDAGPHRFPLRVARSARARRLSLRFHPLQDTVMLTLPSRVSARRADHFLKSRHDWLSENLGDLPPRIPLIFGENIPVLGADTTIIPAGQARHYPAQAVLPVLATPARCEAHARELLMETLRVHISHESGRLARKIGKKVREVVIRDPVSRWGSCSRDGRLMFSWRLVFAPPPVLEYLVAHEVAHLRYMHHGPAFWRQVDRLMPDALTARRWIRQHGPQLYRYGRPSGE